MNQTEGKRVVPVKTGVKARGRLNEDETLATDLSKSVLPHSSPQHLPQCLACQGIHNNSLHFSEPLSRVGHSAECIDVLTAALGSRLYFYSHYR